MIFRPVKDRYYFTRSGLKQYKGKTEKGYCFAPVAKGERTIYYTEDEIKAGAICNPLQQGEIINSKWGKIQYVGYDKKKARYIFQNSRGEPIECSMNDFIKGNIGSQKRTAKTGTTEKGTRPAKPVKQYEDFGRKAPGARKDLYKDKNIDGLTPSLREKLVVRGKIIEKPDWEKMFEETGDRALTTFKRELYRTLPSKPDAHNNIEIEKEYIRYLSLFWKKVESMKNIMDLGYFEYQDFLDQNNFEKLINPDVRGKRKLEPLQDSPFQIVWTKKTKEFLSDWQFRQNVIYFKRRIFDGTPLSKDELKRERVKAYNERKKHLESIATKKKWFLGGVENKALVDYYYALQGDMADAQKNKNRPCIYLRVYPELDEQAYTYRVNNPSQFTENPEKCFGVISKDSRIITLSANSLEECFELAKADYKKQHPETVDSETGEIKKPKKPPLIIELELLTRNTNGKGYNRPRNRDVVGKDFQKTFDLSGEFGNYLSQTERREVANESYDAFNDLAYILGISQRSISLGNKLLIGYASRGRGRAMAHYESTTNVINLTKMRGAGCVSHEWFHAFDYNIGQRAGCPKCFTASYEENPNAVPEPVRRLLYALRRNPDGEITDFFRNAQKIDGSYAKDSYGYWASLVELFARAGDSFVKDELKAQGMRNDYLCGKSQYKTPEGYSINPRGEEAQRINQLFREMIAYCKEQGWIA